MHDSVFSQNRFMRFAGTVLGVLFITAGLAFIGLWQSHEVKLLSVQTGSMAPLLQPGDAVLVRKTDPTTVKTGDVVSYRSPANPVLIITHRVVSIDWQTGRMITKGDANVTADPPASTVAVVGAVQYAMPAAGHIIDKLHSWSGLVVAVYMPAAIILGSELLRLVRHYLRPTYQLYAYRSLDS